MRRQQAKVRAGKSMAMKAPAPAPTPLLPKTVIQCQLNQNTMTVGQEAILTCPVAGLTADVNAISNQKAVPPHFTNLDAAAPYVVQFLGPSRVAQNQVQQTITSYKVGGHDLTALKLTVGGQDYLLAPLHIDVKSVLGQSAERLQLPGQLDTQRETGSGGDEHANNDQNGAAPAMPQMPQGMPGQSQPTPFPIYDPVKVPVPWWWWAIWGLLAALVIGYGLLQILKWRKARNLQDQASQSQKPLSPQELYRSRLRKLESQGFHQRGEYKSFALELTQITKRALADVFKFPAEDQTSEEVLSTLERRHTSFYRRSGSELKSILDELDQIKFAKVETSSAQCLSLLDRSLKLGTALFGGSS